MRDDHVPRRRPGPRTLRSSVHGYGRRNGSALRSWTPAFAGEQRRLARARVGVLRLERFE